MKKIVIIICIVGVVCVGVFAVTTSVNTVPDWEAFVETSKNGAPCETKIEEPAGGITLISYNGKTYTAERSDGTTGSGKYLLTLSGQLPKATKEVSYTVISDKKYTFDEISDDILGKNAYQLDYFLVK